MTREEWLMSQLQWHREQAAHYAMELAEETTVSRVLPRGKPAKAIMPAASPAPKRNKWFQV